MAPPRKIPKAELFAKLGAWRESGFTCKEIARKLDGVYSFRYIQTLCGLLSAIHTTAAIDHEPPKPDAAGDGIRAPAVNAYPSAYPEAKPGNGA